MGACPMAELRLVLGLLSSFQPADGPGWLGPGGVQASGIDLSTVHLRRPARRRTGCRSAPAGGASRRGRQALWAPAHLCRGHAYTLGGGFGSVACRASPTLPGITHDLAAGREHGIVKALADTGIRCWADKAHQGAGRPIRAPFRERWLGRRRSRQDSLCWRAGATLKGWRLLRRVCRRTNRVTAIVEAVLVPYTPQCEVGKGSLPEVDRAYRLSRAPGDGFEVAVVVEQGEARFFGGGCD
ncbi:hypothetical protein GCM10010345_12340 [Streptomyces canarius]|uniref:Transposase DDE domain-containing protein n=1 Tax=Streptomyces canarius TaxID=285453 RepID=A0ABQ3CFH7_9ACTN|nr:hypothetical protein GCM10010345_12340 [Streptomyces canarius]